MARKPVFDTCMLCGECPCLCKRPAKKAAAKKAAPVVKAEPKCSWCTEEERQAGMPCACQDSGNIAPVSPAPVDVPRAPRPDPRAAMRAQVGRSRSVPPPAAVASAPRQANKIVNYVPHTTGDVVIDDAIRCLGSILHADEKARYSDLLWSERSNSLRAAQWRNRRREVLDGLDQGYTA